MKKIMFVILWTVAFAVLGFIAAMIYFCILGNAGMASWSQAACLRAGMSSAVLFYGIPLLGLILGLCGKLPGTKRVQS